jgi:signal transduction histidine kinase
MYSLKSKLSFSYVLVLLTSILLISGFMNFFMDKHFREYVRQNREQRNEDIVAQLRGQYRENGEWNYDGIEIIGVSALENGLIIKIKNIDGETVWDATEHNNGMCQRIIEQMAQNVSMRYPYVNGAYTEIPYNIYSKLSKVGVVEIGSYGPYYLSDHDLAFIDALNKLLIWAGIFSLIFALIIGHLMAKRLSSPISRVITSAQSIAKGYFSDRIQNKSSTSEISQLTATINNLAETMEKQEVLRKRLTGDVAHELRTPLATLQSHMEAMIDGIWKPDTERLVSCHDEIVRISKMVGDLEKLARYEGENLIINRECFDVSELIKRLVNNFEREFLTKNIKVSFSGTTEEIYADKDKISQVIINLLSNAQKYTPQGGLVSINVTGTQDSAEIIVKDNGPGIPAEDLPYIFERFYRADKSRNRLTGGSGIGLTIAKAIVTAHNGKIEVHSKLGEGTEFLVLLPKEEGVL